MENSTKPSGSLDDYSVVYANHLDYHKPVTERERAACREYRELIIFTNGIKMIAIFVIWMICLNRSSREILDYTVILLLPVLFVYILVRIIKKTTMYMEIVKTRVIDIRYEVHVKYPKYNMHNVIYKVTCACDEQKRYVKDFKVTQNYMSRIHKGGTMYILDTEDGYYGIGG